MTRPPPRFPARPDRPDGELLAAFLADRDEIAFAELVRRHGPAVWGVCRRGLPHVADAEDAFQAVFLVLVRRADRLAGWPTVGPWLHRVATTTARDLRRKNARRLARARPLPADVPVPLPPPVPDLDAALLSLPAKYRTPLVLCFLEGLTQRQAAARLGCRPKTLSSHVNRGLAKLRSKLARDPLPLVVAPLPAGLAAATARAAVAFRLASAVPSDAVSRLVEGVLRMFWVKKAAAAGVAGVLILAAGFGLGVSVRHAPATAADDPPKVAETPAAPQPDEHTARLELLTRARDAIAGQVAEYEKRLTAAGAGRDELRPLREHLGRLDADIREIKLAARADAIEVLVHGPADRHPFVVVERDGDGNPDVTAAVRDAAALRRQLARAKADASPRRNVLVRVSQPAKWDGTRAAMDAVRAAGFFRPRVRFHPQAEIRFGPKVFASVSDYDLVVDDFVIEVASADTARPAHMLVGGTLDLSAPAGVTDVRSDAARVAAEPQPDRKGVRLTAASPGAARVTVTDGRGQRTVYAVVVDPLPTGGRVRAVRVAVGGKIDVALAFRPATVECGLDKLALGWVDGSASLRLAGLAAGQVELIARAADGKMEKVIVTVE